MRHMLALGLLTLAAACTPLSLWYREGATVASMTRAQTGCEVRALGQVPVNRQTRFTPVRWVPVQSCDAKGACTTRYEMVGGARYTVDENAPLRARVFAQCMEDAGWRALDLPACPPDVARAAPKAPTTTLPRLTPQSCAVRRDGGFTIVNRG